MTEHPDTTDPLDRMEHDGNRFFEVEWLGENGLSAGILYETASDLAEHVLALVAVARAARDIPPEILAMLPKVRKALAQLEKG